MSGKKMTIARRMRIVSISCAILVEDVGDIGGSDTGVDTLGWRWVACSSKTRF